VLVIVNDENMKVFGVDFLGSRSSELSDGKPHALGLVNVKYPPP
jgi:hypothetical protein